MGTVISMNETPGKVLSLSELDEVSGGFAPLVLMAEGAVLTLAAIGATAVAAAAGILIYEGVTGKHVKLPI